MVVQPEVIAARADALRTLLQQSQQLTQEGVTVLDAYRRKIREVDRVVQPLAQRTNQLSEARDQLKGARDKVEEVLTHLDTSKQVEGQIRLGPAKDFSAFCRSFERLESSIEFLQAHRKFVQGDNVLAASLKLRDDGIKACLEYFSQLLREHTTVPNTNLWQNVEDDARAVDFDLMSAGVCKRLRRLADTMLRNRNEACIRVYMEARRGVLSRVLSGLGDEAQLRDPNLSWDVMQEKIQSWILGVRYMSRMLLPEKRLAETIFVAPYDQQAYHEATSATLHSVLSVGQSICESKKLLEKLFGLLDMHEHLQLVMPIMAMSMQAPQMMPIYRTFQKLDSELQLEVKATFSEFQAELQRSSPKDITADGSVHRLTVYALSYLKRLFGYDSATGILFSQGANTAFMDAQTALNNPRLRDRVVEVLRSVLQTLVKNLDLKAKSYKNKALASLFMMNNLHHIVTGVEKYEILSLVGEEWVEKHKDQVEQYGVQYINMAWGPIIQLVRQDPVKLGKEKVKESLRGISARLDEIQATEGTWQIPNELLRENLRDVIAEDFVKPYEAYLYKFEQAFPSKVMKYHNKYMKYSGTDVKLIIFHKLFMGEQDQKYRHTDSLLDRVGQ